MDKKIYEILDSEVFWLKLKATPVEERMRRKDALKDRQVEAGEWDEGERDDNETDLRAKSVETANFGQSDTHQDRRRDGDGGTETTTNENMQKDEKYLLPIWVCVFLWAAVGNCPYYSSCPKTSPPHSRDTHTLTD